MMAPGQPEHDLWEGISLALPEAWQQALNHWLDGVLAFSGLSLVLGYGVLVLALPLLLLPIAFPELSRPRDALWSLVLAALAPLLLLNRLPVFSSAGFGELIATVLVARLAAEVGQGRWGALTPDQREALRHLPRWRRAGSDLVAAVVQAAKAAWRATAQTAETAWLAVSGSPSPVEQRQPGQSARKPARKQWVRPDSSDGAQVDQDQEAETSPEIPAAAPETGAGAGPAGGNAPDRAEPDQPVADGDGDPVVESANANGEDTGTGAGGETTPQQEQPVRWATAGPVTAVAEGASPEERCAAEPAEGAQPAQPLAGGDGDPGDAEGAASAPMAQPSEGIADHGAESGEGIAEPVEKVQQAQPAGDPGHTNAVYAAPDVAPKAIENRIQPPAPAAQPSTGGVATAVDHGTESGESAAEEPSAPGPVELVAGAAGPAQLVGGTGNPEAGEADASFQDAGNSTPADVVSDDDPEHAAAAGEGGEGFVAVKADAATGAMQEVTDSSAAEAEPAQPAGDGSANPAQAGGEDVVIRFGSFDEVDDVLGGSHWSTG